MVLEVCAEGRQRRLLVGELNGTDGEARLEVVGGGCMDGTRGEELRVEKWSSGVRCVL